MTEQPCWDNLTGWAVTATTRSSRNVRRRHERMPGFASVAMPGPYRAPAAPWTKKPTMFTTVMHGMLVGSPTLLRPVVRRASELEPAGIEARPAIRRGLPGRTWRTTVVDPMMPWRSSRRSCRYGHERVNAVLVWPSGRGCHRPDERLSELHELPVHGLTFGPKVAGARAVPGD